MTTDEKKAYLNSYLAQRWKLQKMQEEYSQLFSRRTSVNVSMDGTPRAKNHSGLEVYAAKRDTLARAIIQQKMKCLDALEDIFWNIEQITDANPAKAEQYKVILTYRHIEGLQWDELAKRIGYARQHTERLYKKALESFSVSVRTI